MTVYKNPVESTMYLEALSLSKLDDWSSTFLANMPEEDLSTVNELMIANNAMLFAGLSREERIRIMYLMFLMKTAIYESVRTGKRLEDFYE
ncbi:hypothetical protein [Chromatium okenii]|nr:hypothetical protein [Chromatium okenii]MBV5307794.1 hypothetical protein [Chromatium okenii]